jgi:hypothetical protein
MSYSSSVDRVDIDEFVIQMKAAFGIVASASTVISHLYAVHQEKAENLTSWSLRLQSIYRQASLLQKALFPKEKRDEFLKTRFWQGLRYSKLQEALRVYKDDDRLTFNGFLQLAREIHQEMEVLPSAHPQMKTHMAAQVLDGSPPPVEKVKARKKGANIAETTTTTGIPVEQYKALMDRVKALELQLAEERASNNRRGSVRDIICHFCKSPGHIVRNCPEKQKMYHAAMQYTPPPVMPSYTMYPQHFPQQMSVPVTNQQGPSFGGVAPAAPTNYRGPMMWTGHWSPVFRR